MHDKKKTAPELGKRGVVDFNLAPVEKCFEFSLGLWPTTRSGKSQFCICQFVSCICVS